MYCNCSTLRVRGQAAPGRALHVVVRHVRGHGRYQAAAVQLLHFLELLRKLLLKALKENDTENKQTKLD